MSRANTSPEQIGEKVLVIEPCLGPACCGCEAGPETANVDALQPAGAWRGIIAVVPELEICVLEIGKIKSKRESQTFSNPALANGARERGSLPVGSGIQNPKRERRGHPSNQQDIRAYTGAFIELLPTLFLE